MLASLKFFADKGGGQKSVAHHAGLELERCLA
jgi:hypothetical protein